MRLVLKALNICNLRSGCGRCFNEPSAEEGVKQTERLSEPLITGPSRRSDTLSPVEAAAAPLVWNLQRNDRDVSGRKLRRQGHLAQGPPGPGATSLRGHLAQGPPRRGATSPRGHLAEGPPGATDSLYSSL
ncbi:unnamed protein product [Pleuronectes platessa]|uniref:Uncharacterized protein n=1 Tax=Pleuronectes platessa TaxID=8262 RepID=A0A9N7YLA1_PLEPL|nr:unnamed protein product [Pleuronectes platessa]